MNKLASYGWKTSLPASTMFGNEQYNLHSVLGYWNWVCTLMAIVFCHELALLERSLAVF